MNIFWALYTHAWAVIPAGQFSLLLGAFKRFTSLTSNLSSAIMRVSVGGFEKVHS